MYMDKFINDSVFREYDIRGVVNKDFNDKLIYNIGKAFGTYLVNNNSKKMSISGDIRKTTGHLKKLLIEGVTSVGVDVYDMGILPTPTNYFSLFTTDIKNSIQITGSHNPPEYNGFKISYNQKPFYGESIQLLKDIIINERYAIDAFGQVHAINVLDNYIAYITSLFNFKETMKVSLDCANASACLVAPLIYKKLDFDISQLYCDVDNNFPNHHPDPTIDSNLVDLINDVKKNRSDFGVAFDGDADRLIVVDDKGRIVRSDILLSIFVPHVVNPNDNVVYDVKCSNSLKETILKYNATPIECKTGHSIIKNKIIECNSKIGGEMSGHIFFSDKYYGYDDAIYVSLRLTEILINTQTKLSNLVDLIPSYSSTPEIRLECDNDKDKFNIVEKINNYFTNNFECSIIDGVKIFFDNGWALIRSSNTQPVIVLRFEANNLDNLNKYKLIIYEKLKEFSDYEFKF